MPTWTIIVIGIAGTFAAFGYIWSKVLKPLARFVDRDLPILEALTKTFANNPELFTVIADMALQFKSNSGSTLRDSVDRLEKAIKEQDVKAKNVAIEAEVIELQAGKSRDRLVDVMQALEEIQGWVRMQKGLKVVTPAAEAAKVSEPKDT